MNPSRSLILLVAALLGSLHAVIPNARAQSTTGVAAQPDQPTPADGAIPISLEEAVSMALENNLDIVVARLGDQAQRDALVSAEGVFRPLVSMTFNNLDSRTPAGTQLIGADTLQQTRTTYNFNWGQELPTGATYLISFNNQRSSTNSAFASFNPNYNSAIRAQATQPLLAGLNMSPSRQRIVVAQNGARTTRHAFEAQVMNTVRDVEFAYWDLVFSIRDLSVAQQSLQLAEDLRRNNRIQVEVGTMAPIDVLEAEAEVASREESVILAEEAIERTADILKRLINDPDSSSFWQGDIVPTAQPTQEAFPIDLNDSVRVALARRPELLQTRVELETREYNVDYTENLMNPQVDLVGSFAWSGLGGTQIVRGDFAGDILFEIPGGYGDALNQVFGGSFRDWSLGVNVSYPLGNYSAEADHAQAQVRARQQRALIDSSELIVAQEVRGAARSVETNRKRIDATRVARELSQRRLEAEQKKFEVGMSTSFLIVQAQRDLSQAAANELRAIIDYNKAIAAFERSRGTILDRRNISVK